jgi:hypothetical protein
VEHADIPNQTPFADSKSPRPPRFRVSSFNNFPCLLQRLHTLARSLTEFVPAASSNMGKSSKRKSSGANFSWKNGVIEWMSFSTPIRTTATVNIMKP